jgi:hypothetical protein
MTCSRAALFVATAVAILLGTACAPPPKEIDYNNPDAGEHPEAPKIVSITPEDGSEGVNLRPIFKLRFDRHIDAKSLSTFRFDLSSGNLGRWLLTVYDPTQKEVLVWPGGYLLPESTWVFSINPGLFSLTGAPVHPDVAVTFRTGKDAVYETPFRNRSYLSDIVPIFEKHCSSCHGGAGEGIAALKLDTKKNILETAIAVPATGRQEWQRIAPTRPGESYLLYKLTNDALISGLRMPRTLGSGKAPPPLSSDEKAALFDWIATGAQFVDP